MTYSWSDFSFKGRKNSITELDIWYWDKVSGEVNKIFYDVWVWSCPEELFRKKKRGDKWNIFVCLLSGNMHIHEELQLKNME